MEDGDAGAGGGPVVGKGGHGRERRYLTIEGQDPVYLVEAGVLSGVKDLVRESNRKQGRDEEKAARLERIETQPEEPE